VNSPKPQGWVRDYAGGLTLRVETRREGRWRIVGDGLHRRESEPAYPLKAIQARADALACAQPTGPWRRVCQRCGTAMALTHRNRPDSGATAEQSELWVCSSAACDHAEPADD
jgi:hypothetical protein